MVKIKREGVLLEATDLEFENQAVLNPTVFQEGETVHLFYRAVKEGNYSSIGYCKLNGPLEIVERSNKPILYPELDFEIHGVKREYYHHNREDAYDMRLLLTDENVHKFHDTLQIARVKN